MPLTAAQLATLKSDIAANANTIPAGQPWTGSFAGQAVSALPNNPDANTAIAGWYNLVASPDFWVWRTKVTKDEYTNSVGPDGTTFTWVGNGFITRSAGEQAAFREMFNGQNAVNPSLANVRQAFVDIFSGTGNAAANRTHMSGVSRARATNFRKLFATGTGSAGSPATMQAPVTEFLNLTLSDVEQARALP